MTEIAIFGIGGTNFRYAVGTGEGELLTEVRIDATDHANLDAQVTDAIRSLESEGYSPVAAGVSCAGLVDASTGAIELMHTPAGDPIRDLDVAGAVNEAFDIPAYVRNDCNVAVLGEYEFGAGRDYDTVVHVTMGTGIGAGVVDHGHLLSGEENFAAEVGYLPVRADSDLSQAGVEGAWEAHCGGRGIPEYVEEHLAEEDRSTELREVESVDPETLFEAASGGDAVAADCLERIHRYNAMGIGALANVFDPGLITLGGGVVLNNADVVLSGIRRHVDDFCLTDGPELAVTGLGGDIGLYGAMALPEWTGRGTRNAGTQ
jgi:glucokinase